MFSGKAFEVIVYPDSYDCEHLSDIIKKFEYIDKWAYGLHDKDEQKPHYHIMIQTNATQDSTRIAKDFGVKESYVEKPKSTKKTHKFDDMLLYLIHRNAPDKYQYAPEDVVASFDYMAFIKKQDNKEKKQNRKMEIVDLIKSGTVREYNLGEYVSAAEYVTYATAIKSAFAYREKVCVSTERNMQVIYITGDSGTGKTSLAKYFAEKRGFDYFVSSSSNDLFYGYGGQPCVILDDVRGSLMQFSDWLKLLDNNVNSTVKARYNNKNLSECKLMILTSVQSVDSFYRDIYDNDSENIVQLKRRCGVHVIVDTDCYYVKQWDKKHNCYSSEKCFKNRIFEEYVKNATENMSALEILGIQDEEEYCRDRKFMDISEKDLEQIEMLFGVENGKKETD